MSRSTYHRCPGKDIYDTYGRTVSMYVRLGNPSKWLNIGRICADCGKVFVHHPPPRTP